MSVSVSVSIINNEKRIKTPLYFRHFQASLERIYFDDRPPSRGYTTNLTKQRMVGIPETIFDLVGGKCEPTSCSR
jgi:hypothetical protein